MVQLALAGEFVPFAVNLAAAEAHDDLRPFLPLAERLGRAVRVAGAPSCRRRVEIAVEGDIGGYDTRIVGLSVLKGLFGGISDEPVTYVNAPQRAKEAGIDVREVSSTTSADYVNLITISGGGHSISGTLPGRRAEHRIVLIDGHRLDVPPADHMLMVTNDDRPGVIGTVGTLLGDAGVNIADMDVGRAAPATRAPPPAPRSCSSPRRRRSTRPPSTPCAPPPASSTSSP